MLRSNLISILFALVFSAGLWVVVVNQQNPEISENLTQTVPVRVENLPAGLILVNQRQLPNVQLRVRATRDVLNALRPTNFKVYIDFSGARPGVADYPIRAEVVSGRGVTIEAVEPDRFSAQLESNKRRDVPVQVNVLTDVPFGYVAQTPRVTPERVAVTGPESLVNQVTQAVVDLRLDNDRTSVHREVVPRPVTAAGDEVTGVAITPDRVVVDVTIDQQVSYRAVAVVPEVVGAVADGYQVVGITVDPVTLTVVGEPSVVDRLQFVRTEPVSIAGLAGDVIRSVDVRLPTGVSLARAQPVTVRVSISAVPGAVSLRLVPQVVGLGPNLRADVAPSSVEVTVSGPMPVIGKLKPADLKVTADVSGLGPGAQQVKLKVDVPSAVKLEGVNPDTVTVTISQI